MTTHVLDSQATSVSRPRGWALWMSVVGLLLALALSSLDATVVGTALPTIVGDLHGFAQYAWVVTAYLLTSTTVAPIVGKLPDQFDPIILDRNSGSNANDTRRTSCTPEHSTAVLTTTVTYTRRDMCRQWQPNGKHQHRFRIKLAALLSPTPHRMDSCTT